MQNYLYTIKQVLVLTGSYVLKGTAANGTGAMDGVDRWSSPTAIIAGTADAKAAGGNSVYYPTGTLGDMAWCCLTDKSGADLLLRWVGGGGGIPDNLGLSYSPGGLFVTSSYHVSGAISPTGSDECHFAPLSSPAAAASHFIITIGNPSAAQTACDKIVNAWIASDGKSCRFNMFCLGASTGLRWGLEQVYMTTGPGAVVWSGSWGFAYASNIAASAQHFTTYNNANTQWTGGQASMTIGGVFKQVQLVMGTEMFNSTPIPWVNIKTDSQGSVGFPIQGVSIGGLSSPAQGKFGNVVDQWIAQVTTAGPIGNVLGNKQFIVVDDSGWLYPWDGVTTPLLQ
jgi:hypothetical protein